MVKRKKPSSLIKERDCISCHE